LQYLEFTPSYCPKNLILNLIHYIEYMSGSESPTISFSKKVDEKGRLVIPKEHRQALTIEGREALVEFEAKKVTYLDEDTGGDA